MGESKFVKKMSQTEDSEELSPEHNVSLLSSPISSESTDASVHTNDSNDSNDSYSDKRNGDDEEDEHNDVSQDQKSIHRFYMTPNKNENKDVKPIRLKIVKSEKQFSVRSVEESTTTKPTQSSSSSCEKTNDLTTMTLAKKLTKKTPKSSARKSSFPRVALKLPAITAASSKSSVKNSKTPTLTKVTKKTQRKDTTKVSETPSKITLSTAAPVTYCIDQNGVPLIPIKYEKNEQIEAKDLDYNEWYAAKIVQVNNSKGKNRVKVHYTNWGTKHDRWFPIGSKDLRGLTVPVISRRTQQTINVNDGVIVNQLESYAGIVLESSPNGEPIVEYGDGVKTPHNPKQITVLSQKTAYKLTDDLVSRWSDT